MRTEKEAFANRAISDVGKKCVSQLEMHRMCSHIAVLCCSTFQRKRMRPSPLAGDWWPTASNPKNIIQRLNRVGAPEKMVMISDAALMQTHSYPPCHATSLFTSGSAFFTNTNPTYPHHRRIGNHLFVDGHVQGISEFWAVLANPNAYKALFMNQ